MATNACPEAGRRGERRQAYVKSELRVYPFPEDFRDFFFTAE